MVNALIFLIYTDFFRMNFKPPDPVYRSAKIQKTDFHRSKIKLFYGYPFFKTKLIFFF